MASSSLPCSYALIKPCVIRHNCSRRPLRLVRAQSYGEEGRSNNYDIVDANLSVLRGRMEEIRMKERLERCYSKCRTGWNLAPGYDYKFKKKRDLSDNLELIGVIGGTFSITCISGTIFVSLLSILLLHLNQ